MDIDTLKSLRERVLAASGPDVAMDAEFATDLFGWTACERVYGTGFKDDKGLLRTWYDLPKFTASIDAALALVERMMPGCGFFILRGEDEAGNTAGLYLRGNGYHAAPEHQYECTAATPPLAILAALLSALIAKDAA